MMHASNQGAVSLSPALVHTSPILITLILILTLILTLVTPKPVAYKYVLLVRLLLITLIITEGKRLRKNMSNDILFVVIKRKGKKKRGISFLQFHLQSIHNANQVSNLPKGFHMGGI